MLFQGKLHSIEMFARNRSPYAGIKDVHKAYQEKYADKHVVVTNGHWWNGYGHFVGNYKVDGALLSQEYGSALGFAWDSGHMPIMTWSEMDEDNFVGTIPVLQAKVILENNIDCHTDSVKRATKRTWFGFTEDKQCVCEVSEAYYTLNEIARRMQDIGIVDGVVLDSGGSSTWYDGHTLILGDGRAILSYMIFIFDKESEEKPVSKFKVCIDPGHGGRENWNCSPDQKYFEHVEVLKIGEKVKALLEKAGVEVLMTRTEDKTVELYERTTMANNFDADLFVSLHTNATGSSSGSGWNSIRGIDVIMYGLGGVREELANKVLKYARETDVIRNNEDFDDYVFFGDGLSVRPDLYVLRHTHMPAILIEYGFHTNQDDVELLLTDEYKNILAEITVKGICEQLGVPFPSDEPTPEPSGDLPSDWATKSWEKYRDLGILDGTRPLDDNTRQELAVVLDRFENYIMTLVANIYIKGGE